MQRGRQNSSPDGLHRTFSQQHTCAFCHPEMIAAYVLQETDHFRLIVDHAPLLEGHLLIIPKQHYTCYGALPATLDDELLTLKALVERFFLHAYLPAVFWEHGIFHQTVFHAHLHCFPFGTIPYPPAVQVHEELLQSQQDLRAWYQSKGQYFYLEDTQRAVLFPPDNSVYNLVVQEVLWPSVVARIGSPQWRLPQERLEQGAPLIEAVTTKWHTFQAAEQADSAAQA